MIAIIKGCGSNIASLQFALERLKVTTELTCDAKKIQAADHVILPGVGSAANAMQTLEQLELTKVIRNLKQPVLGICLGMQLLFESSEESNVVCLGIVPGKIKRFNENTLCIVPHMGWNRLQAEKDCPLLKNIEGKSFQYFVHSYFAPVNEYTVATTHYDSDFAALIQKDNFFGAQFHPEKSGKTGLQILDNFLMMDSRLPGNPKITARK